MSVYLGQVNQGRNQLGLQLDFHVIIIMHWGVGRPYNNWNFTGPIALVLLVCTFAVAEDGFHTQSSWHLNKALIVKCLVKS